MLQRQRLLLLITTWAMSVVTLVETANIWTNPASATSGVIFMKLSVKLEPWADASPTKHASMFHIK